MTVYPFCIIFSSDIDLISNLFCILRISQQFAEKDDVNPMNNEANTHILPFHRLFFYYFLFLDRVIKLVWPKQEIEYGHILVHIELELLKVVGFYVV